MDYVEEVHINCCLYGFSYKHFGFLSSEKIFKKMFPNSMKNIKKIVIESWDIDLIEKLQTYDLSNFPYEIQISNSACHSRNFFD